MLRGAANLAAKVRDMRLYNVGVVFPGKVIQMLQQLALGDNLARVVHQVLEDAIFSRGELNLLLVGFDRLDCEVERQAAIRQRGLPYALAATNEGPRPRDEFAQVERLRHVVICAEVQQLDGALHFRYGREN